jgi:hypothetical protein
MPFINPITPPTAGATVTATGTYTPGTAANVSQFTDSWTLILEVYDTTPDVSALISFEDSLDGFVDDVLAGPFAYVSGGISTKAVVRYSWKMQDWNDLRIGITGAELRAVVQRFSGTSLTFRSWIE